MNTVEIFAFLGQVYDSAYYYGDILRKTIHAATVGKRDMVCLTNGCWVESSHNIPDDWIEWKYNSEKHELIHIRGPSETTSLGWLSVFHNTEDISSFFVSLRHGKSEDTKYIPTDTMLISLFALQNGWMPRGTLTIVLEDASEKFINVHSLFTQHAEEPDTTAD
jgi:hypothetical protein